MSDAAAARPASTSASAGGWAALVTLWLVWGTSWPAMRVVFLEMPVWQFRTVTCFLGGIALLTFVRATGGRVRLRRDEWIPVAVAAFFNMTVWHVASGIGLTMIGAGHAAVVCYTLPVWTALLSVLFLGDKLDARVILSLLCGMGGVAVLASHNFEAIGAKPLGLVIVLIASVSWAIGTILVKRRRWSVGMSALAGWQLLICMPPIAVVAVATERFTMHQASTVAILSGIYTFVFGLIAGYALWFKVVASFPATIAAIGALVIPVIGMMSSALLLNEPLGWREFAALGLVLSAVALVVFRRVAPKPGAG